MLKHLNVVLWCIASPFKLTYVIEWSHEGHKLARNDPIEITILNFFVVFIFFIVELSKIIPTKFYCKFESLKTVLNRAWVRAL